MENVFFDWDVPNWSRSLTVWERYIPEDRKLRCLEIGARRGGLSLMLAQKGHHVICSDLESPVSLASPLHEQYQHSGIIEYKSMDLTRMSCENEFDIIVFKSVLGGVARNHDIQTAKSIAESLLRALKPGGIILLAENSSGTFLHRYLRARFRRWGGSWSYFSMNEIKDIFSSFEIVEIKSFGFFAPFGPGKVIKKLFYLVDKALDRFLPAKSKYVLVAVLRRQKL